MNGPAIGSTLERSRASAADSPVQPNAAAPLARGDEVVAIEHTDPAHARNTLVDWMLGNRCTYACSYCPAELHDGSVPWIAGETIIGFLDAIRRHYADGLGRQVWIQYTGGEPTVHPDFPEILAAGRRAGFRQALISNASRTPRYWSRIVEDIDFAILTYHSEFAEFDHFLSVAKTIRARRPLQVNVTMLPDRFEACEAAARRLSRELGSAIVVMKPLRKDFGSELYDYNPAQLDLMRSRLPGGHEPDAITPRSTMRQRRADGSGEGRRANSFILDGLNRWRGWRCMAGIEALRIKPDGAVYRSVCGVGGMIGRIGSAIEFPTTGVTCDRQSCACISDILITKRRRSGAAVPEPA